MHEQLITKTQTLNDSNLYVAKQLHKKAVQSVDNLRLNPEQQRIFEKSVELAVTGQTTI